MGEFNSFYELNCGEIYSSNLDSCVGVFAGSCHSTIESLPEMSSLELIDLITSSDEFLKKVHTLIEWLKSCISFNMDNFADFIDELFKKNEEMSNSGNHLKKEQIKKLYSMLYKIAKSSSLSECQEVLQMGKYNKLSDILDGGTPFIDFSLHRKLNPEGDHFGKQVQLPDFMNKAKLLTASSNSCLGNHQWILW